ncbi:MAG TPA: hypothetical protein VKR30_07780 [Candidatus Limnocylindrales bacterium]|nr:hypothetical protein [Candidatus Limnocylindrales bacterium]
MVARTGRLLTAVGAVLGSLVLAHSIVFLVRYGSAYGEELAHNGHDLAWSIAVWASIVLGVGLALAGAIQLVRLARAANRTASIAPKRSPTAAEIGRLDPRAFVRSWLRIGGGLAIAVAILLTTQENIERAGVGLTVPGVGLLVSPEYPWAVPIVVGVGLAVGFVLALFRWRRGVLVARLAAARRAALVGRTSALRPRIPWVEPRHAAIVAHQIAGRAPPAVVAA